MKLKNKLTERSFLLEEKKHQILLQREQERWHE